MSTDADARPEPAATPRERPREAAPSPEKPAGAAEPKPRKNRTRRVIVWSILAIVLIAGGIYGYRTIHFYRDHAETDDAQIESHVEPVIPKVGGHVTEVLVEDNQRVEKGQLLLRIDDRDLRAKLATAAADLANARAAAGASRSSVSAAETEHRRAAADLERYQALRQKEEISQQQYDAAKAASEASAAQTQAQGEQVAAAGAKIAQKQADLDLAKLQLSYTTVTAPGAGWVTKKSVEVGQFVQPGQPLLAIVSDAEPWVVANYKETQLKKMHVGQKAIIQVDAYPKRDLHGHVESIAAATGARFALLPPDNATGNFTKVVQRVPVKIVFDEPPDPERRLRAGMSVNAIVDVRESPPQSPPPAR
ncbi:MAG TPA: efflux RND transporter periplasmic adaptor subunit [Thermoanaerobaculia bacterium]|jgi:membrane fusion protein (multidrug efflux system)|nr:efflux RND transporter periplasmic adaptor subunit [Thermoanaerobaculia bacterium]